MRNLIIAMFLLTLWTPLVAGLGRQWTAWEQYRFGWAVPFLCIFLALVRWQDITPGQLPPSGGANPLPAARPRSRSPSPRHSALVCTIVFGMALLLVPVRLVHEPNPLWRLTGLLWALLAVGLTLGTAYIAGGAASVRRYGFSVGFFLVAVPWATSVERFIVQILTRVNAALTVDLLNALGTPAILAGNVIEVGTGAVGLEEACSGIRSLQATLMLTLFLGELYRLGLGWRVWCVVAGVGLASALNFARTALLSWIAAGKSVTEAARWHEPTGVVILVGCFVALYALVLMLKPESLKQRMGELLRGEFPDERTTRPYTQGDTSRPAEQQALIDSDPFARRLLPRTHGARRILQLLLLYTSPRTPISPRAARTRTCIQPADRNPQSARTPRLFALLAGWLIAVEAVTSAWYNALETDQPSPVHWSLQFPVDDPSLTTKPISSRVQGMLGCDYATTATWWDANQRMWAVNYVRWNPGRTAAHLARLHTPAACLPAAGWHLEALPGLRRFGPLQPPLPFRAFRISDELKRSGFVFYCRTGDRRDTETEEDEAPTRWQRLRAVWKGRGEQGMTVLEIAVLGIAEENEAEDAVQNVLAKIIH